MEIEVPIIENSTKPNKIKQKGLHPRKRAMLKALEANLGNITGACEAVGINRWTYYEWLKNDPQFKQECETIPERIKDFVESSLLLQIKDKIPSSTIFFLKTKAKDRGYIEDNVVTNNINGGGFKLIIEDGAGTGSKVETKSETKTGV